MARRWRSGKRKYKRIKNSPYPPLLTGHAKCGYLFRQWIGYGDNFLSNHINIYGYTVIIRRNVLHGIRIALQQSCSWRLHTSNSSFIASKNTMPMMPRPVCAPMAQPMVDSTSSFGEMTCSRRSLVYCRESGSSPWQMPMI